VKEVNDKGHTALHLAAKSGRNQIVALLQEKVGDRCGERERDIERETDTDRQTHRHTETDRNIERERERERERARPAGGQERPRPGRRAPARKGAAL
jgi:ankyrin repeat protein